ncbi:MAG: hypothetical protein HC771_17170 [Synechococcales cyanobacterium CRU_2_2]|nr:hypothetical protein [Synechococcales cyanobacterium CRU_2_2]
MIIDLKTKKSASWETEHSLPLNLASLRMLLSNKIPLIQIKNFASAQECEQLASEANAARFNAYQNVIPKIERIGITVFEYNNIGKQFYFEAVENARKEQALITSVTFNPLQRLMDMIQSRAGLIARTAFEPSYGSYHAGLIRKIENGTQLHVDYAPTEQPGWEVSQITSQLAWNLYLQTPGNGSGKTYVYDRQCQPQDQEYKLDSYGYSEEVIEDAVSTHFEPVVGDVFIFNTQNYHLVEPSQGHRMTFTSAMGLLPSQEVIFWS